jgi:hypothetical protein
MAWISGASRIAIGKSLVRGRLRGARWQRSSPQPLNFHVRPVLFMHVTSVPLRAYVVGCVHVFGSPAKRRRERDSLEQQKCFRPYRRGC